MTKIYSVLKRARISTKKFREILKYFWLDIEATKVAQLTGLNRNTVNKYFLLVRKRIAEECEMESPISGDIEVDESFFGARRVKGKRGRGDSGKTIVLVWFDLFSYLAWAMLSGSIDCIAVSNQTCHQVYDSIADPG